MTAVSMALLELVLIVIMVSTPYPHEYFLEFQMRMVVLTVTSLLLAAVVSERIRSARAVREKDEKLAGVAQILAIGEMSSAIAHEINNPLAALRNYLRSARLMTDAPAIDHAALTTTLDKAVAEAERTSDVVRRLRAFYTAGVVERQGIDPHRVASECLELLSGKLNRLGIRTVVSAAPGLPPVWADPLQISIVLQNLVNNAADALAAEGSPSKEISVVLENAGATVEFRVGDNAGGIALNLVNHLFEPFKTTKAGGMGLGLAICRSLVEANGGRIWLARSGPEGACVAFSVPTGNAVVIEAPHE
jgi:C4-dicarboxylate-specific signal transduction histidine kinase